jgi:hypothetical protein
MFLPVLVLTQLLLIMSVTCLLAALTPFFPDLRAILDNILLMLFFLSGVFFDISRLPASIQGVSDVKSHGRIDYHVPKSAHQGIGAGLEPTDVGSTLFSISVMLSGSLDFSTF